MESHYLKPRILSRDNEGNTFPEYGTAVPFTGEVWQASGRVQAQMYGEKLAYVRNVKIQGDYSVRTDSKGTVYYDFTDGLTVCEKDGLCLDVGDDADPDYEIISIKPYKPWRLEAMRR